MATFRLAFHGTIMTGALSQSLLEPSQEQLSLLAHQMLAHLESLDTAAKSAASIVASMRVLLLQLTGLTSPSVSPGLQALPYSGEALFGPQLRLYLDEAAQLSNCAAPPGASQRISLRAPSPSVRRRLRLLSPSRALLTLLPFVRKASRGPRAGVPLKGPAPLGSVDLVPPPPPTHPVVGGKSTLARGSLPVRGHCSCPRTIWSVVKVTSIKIQNGCLHLSTFTLYIIVKVTAVMSLSRVKVTAAKVPSK
jgi:hypothetical protein